MPINESAKITSKEQARTVMLLLGHGVDWWNGAMLVALGIVAFAAFAAFFTTTAAIIVQRRQSDADARAFSAYKLTVEGKVADAKTAGIAAGTAAGDAILKAAQANERAGLADERAAKVEQENIKLRLSLEERTVPLVERRLKPEQIAALASVFKGSGINLMVMVLGDDKEVNAYADDFKRALDLAEIKYAKGRADRMASRGVTTFAAGVNISGADGRDKTILEAALRKANISFGTVGSVFPPGVIVGDGMLQLVVGQRPDLKN